MLTEKRIKMNRELFLGRLEEVKYGLSPKEVVEQSNCFVFKGGTVTTFNQEFAGRNSSGLPATVEVAITADPLFQLLRKLSEDELEIEVSAKSMVIYGKSKRAEIKAESEILLPIEHIDEPTTWSKLPDDFADALNVVQECASTDQGQTELICVHITPEFVEATDRVQVIRYRLKTGIEQRCLIRKESAKAIGQSDVSKVSISPSWLHFKNKAGLILSCRRFETSGYPELGQYIEGSGTKVILPKALTSATEKAEIFSAENSENNWVRIELSGGKIKLTGEGSAGSYREIRKVEYSGPPMAFLMSPKSLREILKRHPRCEICPGNRMKIVGNSFDYVASLEDTGDDK